MKIIQFLFLAICVLFYSSCSKKTAEVNPSPTKSTTLASNGHVVVFGGEFHSTVGDGFCCLNSQGICLVIVTPSSISEDGQGGGTITPATTADGPLVVDLYEDHGTEPTSRVEYSYMTFSEIEGGTEFLGVE